MELNEEDRKRIEQANTYGPGAFRVAFNDGAEYATRYERQLWIKQCEELIRTRNVMSEGYKLEINRLEAERSEVRNKVIEECIVQLTKAGFNVDCAETNEDRQNAEILFKNLEDLKDIQISTESERNKARLLS